MELIRLASFFFCIFYFEGGWGMRGGWGCCGLQGSIHNKANKTLTDPGCVGGCSQIRPQYTSPLHPNRSAPNAPNTHPHTVATLRLVISMIHVEGPKKMIYAKILVQLSQFTSSESMPNCCWTREEMGEKDTLSRALMDTDTQKRVNTNTHPYG